MESKQMKTIYVKKGDTLSLNGQTFIVQEDGLCSVDVACTQLTSGKVEINMYISKEMAQEEIHQLLSEKCKVKTTNDLDVLKTKDTRP